MAFLPAPRTQIHQDRCVLFSNFDDGFLRLLFGSISKLRKTLTVKNKGPAKKRQKKKEQNPDDMDRENNELTPDCQPESLLNDPCLRTLLSPEDLAVFQDVEQFCASVRNAQSR